MVEFGWVSKSRDAIFEEPISYSFASLVSGGVCLCKPSEMIDHHQNVSITTLTGLKVEKVYANKFKRSA